MCALGQSGRPFHCLHIFQLFKWREFEPIGTPVFIYIAHIPVCQASFVLVNYSIVMLSPVSQNLLGFGKRIVIHLSLSCCLEMKFLHFSDVKIDLLM
jgi:hypothetical protein